MKASEDSSQLTTSSGYGRSNRLLSPVAAGRSAVILLPGLLALVGCLSQGPAHQAMKPALVYPKTATVNQVDDFHGTKVADPYRWLEDENSAETKAWVEAENKVTFAYLSQIPERARIKERLTQLWNYERFGVPFKEGGRYFFTKNDGLQNQGVLYTLRALDQEPQVLLDPNKLSADGTVALNGHSISDDGKLMAYGLSAAGSDWQEWKVREIETGRDLPDDIKWVKSSSAAWTKDGKGFFYSRYDEPDAAHAFQNVNYFHKLYYHRLGTAQSEDRLVYHRPDQKEWGFSGHVTDDGRYLIITVWHGTETRNRVFYQDLEAAAGPVVELLNDFDASYSFIDNIGTVFYFRTDLKAPRGRILAIDVTQPGREHWKEIIPQGADRLQGANLLNDQFIALYLKDAHSEVKIFDMKGAFVRRLELPGIGSASGFGGKRTDTETFYAFTSFTVPTTVCRYDARAGATTVFRQPKVKFNPSDYETKQVFYTSKDGTRVPMFITHKKGLKLNGKNPAYLYGYGGFDISLTPGFSVNNLVWMEMGGVFAQPSLRGGGEYGQEWHQAGTKLKKQNVFDDFLAAAEWLIANKYTSPEKLANGGGSNGGLLVGACLAQRPELFRAALPALGVMDMLRFHKFTRGWAWTSDYGSPDNPEEFKALYAYSPYHNLKPGTAYPATLVTTADHDDRVVPAHSFKFAAALQAAQAGSAPTLIRIETKAGHGAGKPTTKVIDESADRWAFLVRELEMSVPVFDTGVATKIPTMAGVLAGSKAADWRPLDPENTLYVELPTGRVVIELAPAFAPRHVANVKTLAREGYFDGLAILRCQDNYVVQWGDPDAEKPELKRKIQRAQPTLPAEFDCALDSKMPFTRLPDGDLYAPEVGFSGGFPVARDPKTRKTWLVHGYGMVGAGRDVALDSGGGAELYVVIGHAPRHLDRNVTLLGRVVQGMELFSALPRGPGAMGFYEKPEQRVPLKGIRVAADVPASERTALEVMRTERPIFQELIEARRNRREDWYHVQAGHIEIGNVPIPVRPPAGQPTR